MVAGMVDAGSGGHGRGGLRLPTVRLGFVHGLRVLDAGVGLVMGMGGLVGIAG